MKTNDLPPRVVVAPLDGAIGAQSISPAVPSPEKKAIVTSDSTEPAVKGGAKYGALAGKTEQHNALPQTNTISLRAPRPDQAAILAAMAGGKDVVDRDAAKAFIDGIVKGRKDGTIDSTEALVFQLLLGNDLAFAGHLVALAKGEAAPIAVPGESTRGSGLLARHSWFDSATAELVDRKDLLGATVFQIKDSKGGAMEIRTAIDEPVELKMTRPGHPPVIEKLDGGGALELSRALLAAMMKSGALGADGDAFAKEREAYGKLLDRAGATPPEFQMPPGVELDGSLRPWDSKLTPPGPLPDGTKLEKLAAMTGAVRGYGMDVELFTPKGQSADGPIYRRYQAMDPAGGGWKMQGPELLTKGEAEQIKVALARSADEGHWDDAFYKGMQPRALLDVLYNVAEKEQPSEMKTVRAGKLDAMLMMANVARKTEVPRETRIALLQSLDKMAKADLDLPVEGRQAIADLLEKIQSSPLA